MPELALPRRVEGVWPGDGVLCGEGGRPLCEVNETATAIWELCDGGTRPDEMAIAISTIAGLPVDEVVGQVVVTLEALASVGAVEWVGRP